MDKDLARLELIPFTPELHQDQVATFNCGDDDLNDFLRSDASKYQQENLSQTNLAVLDEELVGYITLLTDSIVLKTNEKRKLLGLLRSDHASIVAFPALKIGRLGVQKELRENGIGSALLEYAVGVARRLNTALGVGCRFITLDAYPSAMEFYTKFGFVLNKNYEDKNNHPSMRFDILQPRSKR